MVLKIVKKKNKIQSKQAVITIAGTIGGVCKGQKGEFKYDNKATYRSKVNEIQEGEAINILPILYKTFHSEYDIKVLHTQCAKDIQTHVLAKEGIIDDIFDKQLKIEDDEDFDLILSRIDNLISSYDKVIIDISHGYRHLPLLVIINAIMHNIEKIEKVEKILFAKEIEKNKIYEIIDLKRYLDLANITYALTTFDRNYTVSNNIKVNDKDLNEFLEELSNFSKHILANSIDALIRDTKNKKSICSQLKRKIETLKNDKCVFKNLERLLNKVYDHINQIHNFQKEANYIRLYKLSENMFHKGYFLNSITMISEAIGMYCAKGLQNLNPFIKKKIEEYEKRAIHEKNNERLNFKLYELYNQAKALYNVNNYTGNFLSIKNKKEWNESIKNLTQLITKKIQKDDKLTTLIRNIDSIRNNLAHANSSQRLSDVQKNIEEVFKEFKQLCIEENILKIK